MPLSPSEVDLKRLLDRVRGHRYWSFSLSANYTRDLIGGEGCIDLSSISTEALRAFNVQGTRAKSVTIPVKDFELNQALADLLHLLYKGGVRDLVLVCEPGQYKDKIAAVNHEQLNDFLRTHNIPVNLMMMPYSWSCAISSKTSGDVHEKKDQLGVGKLEQGRSKLMSRLGVATPDNWQSQYIRSPSSITVNKDGQWTLSYLEYKSFSGDSCEKSVIELPNSDESMDIVSLNRSKIMEEKIKGIEFAANRAGETYCTMDAIKADPNHPDYAAVNKPYKKKKTALALQLEVGHETEVSHDYGLGVAASGQREADIDLTGMNTDVDMDIATGDSVSMPAGSSMLSLAQAVDRIHRSIRALHPEYMLMYATEQDFALADSNLRIAVEIMMHRILAPGLHSESGVLSPDVDQPLFVNDSLCDLIANAPELFSSGISRTNLPPYVCYDREKRCYFKGNGNTLDTAKHFSSIGIVPDIISSFILRGNNNPLQSSIHDSALLYPETIAPNDRLAFLLRNQSVSLHSSLSSIIDSSDEGALLSLLEKVYAHGGSTGVDKFCEVILSLHELDPTLPKICLESGRDYPGFILTQEFMDAYKLYAIDHAQLINSLNAKGIDSLRKEFIAQLAPSLGRSDPNLVFSSMLAVEQLFNLTVALLCSEGDPSDLSGSLRTLASQLNTLLAEEDFSPVKPIKPVCMPVVLDRVSNTLKIVGKKGKFALENHIANLSLLRHNPAPFLDLDTHTSAIEDNVSKWRDEYRVSPEHLSATNKAFLSRDLSDCEVIGEILLDKNPIAPWSVGQEHSEYLGCGLYDPALPEIDQPRINEPEVLASFLRSSAIRLGVDAKHIPEVQAKMNDCLQILMSMEQQKNTLEALADKITLAVLSGLKSRGNSTPQSIIQGTGPMIRMALMGFCCQGKGDLASCLESVIGERGQETVDALWSEIEACRESFGELSKSLEAVNDLLQDTRRAAMSELATRSVGLLLADGAFSSEQLKEFISKMVYDDSIRECKSFLQGIVEMHDFCPQVAKVYLKLCKKEGLLTTEVSSLISPLPGKAQNLYAAVGKRDVELFGHFVEALSPMIESTRASEVTRIIVSLGPIFNHAKGLMESANVTIEKERKLVLDALAGELIKFSDLANYESLPRESLLSKALTHFNSEYFIKQQIPDSMAQSSADGQDALSAPVISWLQGLSIGDALTRSYCSNKPAPSDKNAFLGSDPLLHVPSIPVDVLGSDILVDVMAAGQNSLMSGQKYEALRIFPGSLETLDNQFRSNRYGQTFVYDRMLGERYDKIMRFLCRAAQGANNTNPHFSLLPTFNFFQNLISVDWDQEVPHQKDKAGADAQSTEVPPSLLPPRSGLTRDWRCGTIDTMRSLMLRAIGALDPETAASRGATAANFLTIAELVKSKLFWMGEVQATLLAIALMQPIIFDAMGADITQDRMAEDGINFLTAIVGSDGLKASLVEGAPLLFRLSKAGKNGGLLTPYTKIAIVLAASSANHSAEAKADFEKLVEGEPDYFSPKDLDRFMKVANTGLCNHILHDVEPRYDAWEQHLFAAADIMLSVTRKIGDQTLHSILCQDGTLARPEFLPFLGLLQWEDATIADDVLKVKEALLGMSPQLLNLFLESFDSLQFDAHRPPQFSPQDFIDFIKVLDHNVKFASEEEISYAHRIYQKSSGKRMGRPALELESLRNLIAQMAVDEDAASELKDAEQIAARQKKMISLILPPAKQSSQKKPKVKSDEAQDITIEFRKAISSATQGGLRLDLDSLCAEVPDLPAISGKTVKEGLQLLFTQETPLQPMQNKRIFDSLMTAMLPARIKGSADVLQAFLEILPTSVDLSQVDRGVAIVGLAQNILSAMDRFGLEHEKPEDIAGFLVALRAGAENSQGRADQDILDSVLQVLQSAPGAAVGMAEVTKLLKELPCKDKSSWVSTLRFILANPTSGVSPEQIADLMLLYQGDTKYSSVLRTIKSRLHQYQGGVIEQFVVHASDSARQTDAMLESGADRPAISCSQDVKRQLIAACVKADPANLSLVVPNPLSLDNFLKIDESNSFILAYPEHQITTIINTLGTLIARNIINPNDANEVDSVIKYVSNMGGNTAVLLAYSGMSNDAEFVTLLKQAITQGYDKYLSDCTHAWHMHHPIDVQYNPDAIHELLSRALIHGDEGDCAIPRGDLEILGNAFLTLDSYLSGTRKIIAPDGGLCSVSDLSNMELRALLHEKKKSDPSNDSTVEVIALSIVAFHRVHGQSLRPAQRLAVLLPFFMSQTNLVEQVRTGEGKTAISLVSAVAHWFNSKDITVTMATSNIALAHRDLQYALLLLDLLDVRHPDNVITKDSQELGFLAGAINHCDYPGLALNGVVRRVAKEGADLPASSDIAWLPKEGSSANNVTIMDEVDAFISSVHCTLAQPSRLLGLSVEDQGILCRIVADYMSGQLGYVHPAAINANYHNFCSIYFDRLSFADDTPDDHKKVIEHVRNFCRDNPDSKKLISDCLTDYQAALSLKEGVDYIIEKQESQSQGLSRIVPMLDERPDSNLIYQGMVQQMLTVKIARDKGLNLVFPSYTSKLASFAPADIIRDHIPTTDNPNDRILGLTGTPGEGQRVAQLLKDYGAVVLEMPRDNSNICVMADPQFAAGEVEQHKLVLDCIKNRMASGCPIAVFCDDARSAQELYSHLVQALPAVATMRLCDLTGGPKSMNEQDAIATAGVPGNITIFTKATGRGADIATDHPEGLTVINASTKITRNQRSQIHGRAARGGKPGFIQDIPNMKVINSMRPAAKDNTQLLATWEEFMDLQDIDFLRQQRLAMVQDDIRNKMTDLSLFNGAVDNLRELQDFLNQVFQDTSDELRDLSDNDLQEWYDGFSDLALKKIGGKYGDGVAEVVGARLQALRQDVQLQGTIFTLIEDNAGENPYSVYAERLPKIDTVADLSKVLQSIFARHGKKYPADMRDVQKILDAVAALSSAVSDVALTPGSCDDLTKDIARIMIEHLRADNGVSSKEFLDSCLRGIIYAAHCGSGAPIDPLAKPVSDAMDILVAELNPESIAAVKEVATSWPGTNIVDCAQFRSFARKQLDDYLEYRFASTPLIREDSKGIYIVVDVLFFGFRKLVNAVIYMWPISKDRKAAVQELREAIEGSRIDDLVKLSARAMEPDKDRSTPFRNITGSRFGDVLIKITSQLPDPSVSTETVREITGDGNVPLGETAVLPPSVAKSKESTGKPKLEDRIISSVLENVASKAHPPLSQDALEDGPHAIQQGLIPKNPRPTRGF